MTFRNAGLAGMSLKQYFSSSVKSLGKKELSMECSKNLYMAYEFWALLV